LLLRRANLLGRRARLLRRRRSDRDLVHFPRACFLARRGM